MAETKSKACNE